MCLSTSIIGGIEWVVFPFVREFSLICRNSKCGHTWIDRSFYRDHECPDNDCDPIQKQVGSPSRGYCECGGVGVIATSTAIHKGMLKQFTYDCKSCQGSWVEYREFLSTVSPSALLVSKNEHPRLIYGEWGNRIILEISEYLGTKTLTHKKENAQISAAQKKPT